MDEAVYLLWSVLASCSESAPLSLDVDEEARLYTTNAERERYEPLATFMVLSSHWTIYLEHAYVRHS